MGNLDVLQLSIIQDSLFKWSIVRHVVHLWSREQPKWVLSQWVSYSGAWMHESRTMTPSHKALLVFSSQELIILKGMTTKRNFNSAILFVWEDWERVRVFLMRESVYSFIIVSHSLSFLRCCRGRWFSSVPRWSEATTCSGLASASVSLETTWCDQWQTDGPFKKFK